MWATALRQVHVSKCRDRSLFNQSLEFKEAIRTAIDSIRSEFPVIKEVKIETEYNPSFGEMLVYVKAKVRIPSWKPVVQLKGEDYVSNG